MEPSRGVVMLPSVQDWLPAEKPRKGDRADTEQFGGGGNAAGERRWGLE